MKMSRACVPQRRNAQPFSLPLLEHRHAGSADAQAAAGGADGTATQGDVGPTSAGASSGPSTEQLRADIFRSNLDLAVEVRDDDNKLLYTCLSLRNRCKFAIQSLKGRDVKLALQENVCAATERNFIPNPSLLRRFSDIIICTPACAPPDQHLSAVPSFLPSVIPLFT